MGPGKVHLCYWEEIRLNPSGDAKPERESLQLDSLHNWYKYTFLMT